jgi:hypothetical protein
VTRRKPIKRGAVRVVFAPLLERHLSDKQRAEGLSVWGITRGRVIQLDPRVDFVDTITHELLHVRHPNWTEKQVIEETASYMKSMTWKDKARLLRDVCSSALLEGEDVDSHS